MGAKLHEVTTIDVVLMNVEVLNRKNEKHKK